MGQIYPGVRVITEIEQSDVAEKAYLSLVNHKHTQKAVTSRKDASSRPKHVLHHPQHTHTLDMITVN